MTPNAEHSPGFSPNRAAARTMALLEKVTDSPGGLTLNDLSAAVGAPRSSVHSLLRTLTDLGYLKFDGSRYSVSHRLATLVSRLPITRDLPTIARPMMEELSQQVGETSVLGVLSGTSIVYLTETEAPQLIRYVAPIGVRVPVYCTAIGKAILAAMEPDQAKALIDKIELKKLTAQTKTSKAAVMKDVAEARERGWALSASESWDGIIGIACSIDRADSPAAVGIAAPETRAEPAFHRSLAEAVVLCAQNISSRLESAGRQPR